DYDFASESGHGFILFAGGQLRVLNPDGTLRAGFDYEADEDEQPVFFKSCAIAPDGATLAVHALMENADRILVFEIRQNEARLRETDDFTLPGIYPHLLHMAVNAHGVLVAAPDRTLLFGLQGQDDLDEPFENPEGGIYRPVLAGRDYFVYASGLQEVRVLDADGFEMVRVPLTATGVRYNLNTWRILAGREPRVFVLHSPDRLDFYRVQEFTR
ncbi:MAG: hypothetical protein KDK30_11280, partial [Leptospiraceae bacterium]|nr:hypothetical protein [Leptospiraceae bacterium]